MAITLVGTNPKRIRGYYQWEVHEDDTMICTFYGPSSHHAAVTFMENWKMRKEGTGTNIVERMDKVKEEGKNLPSLN
jgi:hypothetical protein